ncbi:ABC transporter ATP-binding protein [Thermobifida cellulosilytica]|uniref:ABC transporter ATP-binding protein n=1 Tax=Thermobifida cellulosilytica TB100 TaxID=665004 RepID=A0A147KGD4_THECS|nr:ABC transporter ATP-binding protein [Thermobifida cellulosilytica]KUP96350.1 ABC transporter ATP-binding protein [Thermobifida cellulosilytica TB100]
MSSGGPGAAVLDAHLVVRRPGFGLDVRLRVALGQVLALLGPNGAGKSTALRALAGLVPLSEGHVLVDGADVTTAPAERRPVGMVFQDYLLFPHLSVVENVAFGPRCRGVPARRARRLALDLLAEAGLDGYAAARPGALSGGQQQRVALARALAVRPRLLLLDEPMAALDAHTRVSVRTQLRRRLAAFAGATVLVTHDPLDAMVLADRVLVLEGGAAVQEGSPAEVARRPRTGYVARLVGVNLYRGRASGTRVRLAASSGEGAVLTVAESVEGEVFAAFPPRAVALYRERPAGSPRNVWPLTVDGVEPFGDRVRVHLTGVLEVNADITAAALAELALSPGVRVWAGVKATEVECYPA